MKKETLEKFVTQLDGMIASLQQAVVIGARSTKEASACVLLQDARLKLVEEIEAQEAMERGKLLPPFDPPEKDSLADWYGDFRTNHS